MALIKGSLGKFARGFGGTLAKTEMERFRAQIIEERDAKLAAIRQQENKQSFEQKKELITLQESLKDQNPRTGQYNPGDFTPQSWANFVKGGKQNPELLERYEAPQHVTIAGVPHVFDKSTGSYVRAKIQSDTENPEDIITAEDVAEDTSAIAQAESSGKKTGTDIEATRTKRIEIGADAAKGIPTLIRGLELLETVETGGPEKLALSIKQKLGAENADEGELANILGKAVLSQLRAVFGAQFTEREGERLDTIEANFGKSAATNKRLLNQLYQLAEKEANQAIKDAEKRGDQDTANAIRESMNFRYDPDFDIFGSINAAPQESGSVKFLGFE